jgi:dipeptidyl aminopeptidase/acylaminoacyl peptidase
MADVLTLAALRALVQFSDPQISPDGTRIAYVRSTDDYAKDETVSTLVLTAADGSWTRTLASGDGVASPRWSPDGHELAFLRNDGNKNAQITTISARGGHIRVVTHTANGVEHFAWDPSGTRFAFDTVDADPRADAVKHHDDLFDIGDDGFLISGPALPSHLWLVAANGGSPRRLTHGTWSVFEGVAPFAGAPSDPSWSSDGRTIVFAKSPDAHTATTDRSTIAAVDVASGTVRELSSAKRYEYAPVFAPRGDGFAYLRPHGPGPISVLDAIVGSRENGASEADRTTTLDHDIVSAQWMANGSLLALASDHLGTSFFTIPSQGAPRRIDIGALVPSAMSVAHNGTIAFIASTWSQPSELYVLHPGAAPRALTHANAALAAKAYGRAETLRWTAPDGTISEGVLVHPAGEVPGKHYPLIVWLHGGPEAAITTAWSEGTDEGFPFGAYVAGRGAFVFMPNYRGSDDLGTAHEHAIFGDPAAGPASDILAGLTSVLAHAPIDTTRIGVGGHSYGAYLTSWLIGHDARWKCAVVADGSPDWVAAYDLSGTGNLAFTRDSLGGSPWNPAFAQRYHDTSPITYAHAIRTPTLIITGLADEVVPYIGSFTLYHAIKEQHVPVRLVGIPTAHHTPGDPVRHEAYERTILTYFANAFR